MVLVVESALSNDPVQALRQLAQGEDELAKLRYNFVSLARRAGVRWEQIGEALGISRQSAWEAYSRRTRAIIATQESTDVDESEALALAVDEVKAVRRSKTK